MYPIIPTVDRDIPYCSDSQTLREIYSYSPGPQQCGGMFKLQFSGGWNFHSFHPSELANPRIPQTLAGPLISGKIASPTFPQGHSPGDHPDAFSLHLHLKGTKRSLHELGSCDPQFTTGLLQYRRIRQKMEKHFIQYHKNAKGRSSFQKPKERE